MSTSRCGKIFVVSAPSGAGKTTLVNAVAHELDHIRISISYTTRQPRPGDQMGVHYHFISDADFDAMQKNNLFLEHASVFGCRYGTGKEWIQEQRRNGIDVILEIDWQGAHQLKKTCDQVVSVFILPPSLKALSERLLGRQQDSETTIQSRMNQARSEMMHYSEFDYLIINEHIAQSKEELKNIIQSERLRLNQQIQEHSGLLHALLG